MKPPEASPSPLERFYRFHAPIYDQTRVFILFGRRELVRRLRLKRGDRVLDVGCGTGWNFPPLLRAGARLTGVEPSREMRERAQRRAGRLPGEVSLDPSPYGSHGDYLGSQNAVLFSYSLTMIPSFSSVLTRAKADLAPGGRIGVVDFLDGTNAATRWWLGANHVTLGPERLDLLKELFPAFEVEVRSAALWRYFLFVGSPS
jgi:S-adenosylmethionine-diacylgycerolhomoserine-N-methlytransferase